MRHLMSAFVLSSMGGCALWMPSPNPDQAWIALQTSDETDLRAIAVDAKPLSDDRYFQVTPGNHELGMRYRFQVDSGNMGADQPLQRNCRLLLEYADFSAGTRYRLVAGQYGFRPWAKLLDDQDNLLARAAEKGCDGV